MNVWSFTRVVGTASAAAARSLSRVPIITRPARERRMARTTSAATATSGRGRTRSAPTGCRCRTASTAPGGNVVVGHEVGEVDRVEEVRVERHRERDRGDREVEAPDAQGREADGDRDDARRRPSRAPAATNRSTFQRVSRLPAAIAPMPTMPNWPRLMLPPQPVSTTSDIADEAPHEGEAQRGHASTG